MSDKLSRRRILKGLAATSTAALAGCGSVIDRIGSSGDASADSEQVTRTTTARETGSPSDPVPDEEGEDSTRTEAKTETQTQTEAQNQTQTETQNQTETQEAWSVDDVTIDAPADSFASVPLPDDDTLYASMGSAADTATLYGSWKCPHTRAFVLDQLPEIVDEFVRPGHLSIEFRAVAYRGGGPFLGADAPRATRGGLGVWAMDPDSFWQYFMYVFANQPHEDYQWATPELLVRFAKAAGVRDPEQIERVATTETYTELVEQAVTSAAQNDVWTVPRIVYDGEVTAPTADPEQTREQLERARDQ